MFVVWHVFNVQKIRNFYGAVFEEKEPNVFSVFSCVLVILKKRYSKNKKKTSRDIIKKLLSPKYDPNRPSSFRDIHLTDRPTDTLGQNSSIIRRENKIKFLFYDWKFNLASNKQLKTCTIQLYFWLCSFHVLCGLKS